MCISRLTIILWLTVATALLPTSGAKADLVSTLGPVSIQGKFGNFQILVSGQVVATDREISTLFIADAFPSRDHPEWVLLSYGRGGNVCAAAYKILNLRTSPPALSSAAENCNALTYIGSPSQVIITDGAGDIWFYTDSDGMGKAPKLTIEDHIRRGTDAYKSGDFDLALRHLWPSAASKDPQAPYLLGLMWHLGKGVDRDYKRAKEFYEAAAALGYAPAMFRVGTLYANGRGVAVDFVTANSWYRRAADLGDGSAQYNLGLNILAGRGATKSAKEAYFWFLLATERLVDPNDLEAAKKNLERTLPQLSDAELAEVRRQALGWQPATFSLFTRAADLKAWIGKHPFNKVNGFQMSEVPELAVRLKLVFGDKAARSFPMMDGPGSVAEQDGWLVVNTCQAHFCNKVHFDFAVELQSYEIVGCARYGDFDRQTEVWGGTNFTAVSRELVTQNEDQCDIHRLGPEGIFAALERLAPRDSTPSVTKPPKPVPPPQRTVGTGYVIDHMTSIVTNAHVVKGCGSISVRQSQTAAKGTIIASDTSNDLALIRADLPDLTPVYFREGRGIRPAESVVALGYPYAGLLSTMPQSSTGTVTALAGIGDDTRLMQISAPIQPGNSGGPIFDLSGNVVGTVVSTLDAIAIAELTGSVPQNVNFGIKASVVRDFLDSNGVTYATRASTEKLDPADVSEQGMRSVVMIECTK